MVVGLRIGGISGAAGFSGGHLTDIPVAKAGKRNPSLETLFRLALGLKLEITELLKP